MASINSAFSIITSALNAEQSAINIASNNVANANTAGYTREQANFAERSPVLIGADRYGTGVEQTGATSVRDRILQERLLQQKQSSSGSSARLSALETVQSLFTPSSGTSSTTAGDIGSDLTSFFSSFASLEADPSNNALRQQVLSTASTLAGDVSNTATTLNAQREQLNQQVGAVTSQVNELLTQVAEINQEIQSSSPNGDAGVREDQRQKLLGQLSELIGFHQVKTENNGISLETASGQLLVSGSKSFALTTGTVNGVSHLYLGTTDVTTSLATTGGQLGGYLTARDQDIPEVLQGLDELAYNVTTQVNTLNNAGSNLNGLSGNAGSIFNDPTQVTGSAAMMSVVMTDPNAIAAASAGKGAGDNSNSVALAALGKQAIVNGHTPINAISNLVSRLGSKVAEVETQVTARASSMTQLQAQIDALSGVNLNDEAALLQQYQRAYEAGAKVFAILNSVMATAINLGQNTAVS